MFIAYGVLAVLYSATLVFSGVGKLTHNPQMVQIIHHQLGVPLQLFPVLAACEFAAAAGLVAGIRWPPLGIGAAGGAVVYFIGAIVSHLRVGDAAGTGEPSSCWRSGRQRSRRAGRREPGAFKRLRRRSSRPPAEPPPAGERTDGPLSIFSRRDHRRRLPPA